jgi:hypothetical protein
MMCRENFIFHFSCSLGLKSLSFHSQGSTTTFEKLCVKFIDKDIKFKACRHFKIKLFTLYNINDN